MCDEPPKFDMNCSGLSAPNPASLTVPAYHGMEENLLEKLVENLRLGLSALSRLTFQ